MRNVVIAGYLRTPISRSRPARPEADLFGNIRMDDCAAMLVRELLKRHRLEPGAVDRCIIGCANQSGEQWLYGGRAVSLLADLPFGTPAMAVDVQCGSSMAAIHLGTMEIAAGYSDVVLAGGLEHMTRVPMRSGTRPNRNLLRENRFDPARIGKTVEQMYAPQEQRYGLPSMGDTAELLAAEGKISREEMNRWAERSHRRAAQAYREGFFSGEILPIAVEREGELTIIDRDQSVREDTSYAQIASLPPAFRPDGLITAGNSSPLDAGAAMVLLMSEEKALACGLRPLATIVSLGWGGVDPLLMGQGPLPASRMALEKAGLKVEDIDFWEINEAFAVVPLWNIKALGLDPEKVNVKGGAIALGHPLGMSGARLVGTLARILAVENGFYGMAAICVGGGQGLATLLRRC